MGKHYEYFWQSKSSATDPVIKTENDVPMIKIVVISDTSHLDGLVFPETEATNTPIKCPFILELDYQKEMLSE